MIYDISLRYVCTLPFRNLGTLNNSLKGTYKQKQPNNKNYKTFHDYFVTQTYFEYQRLINYLLDSKIDLPKIFAA